MVGAGGIFDYKRKAIWQKSFILIGNAHREGRESLGPRLV